MQTIERDGLTAAEVQEIVKADNVEVDFGCELLNHTDRVIEDISDDLAGGWVERGNYRTIHNTCELLISRELDWGAQRVKPYMTLAAGGRRFRADLGVYLMGVPEREAGEDPQTFRVSGYDKLLALDTPMGMTYQATAGQTYLSRVESVVNGAFHPLSDPPLVDGHSAAKTLPTTRQWPIDPDVTHLRIANDLLAAVGYQALWADWNGRFRCSRYIALADRASEWTYDADNEQTTTVGEERVGASDFTDTPNKWIFIRDDPERPIAANDGIYVVNNVSDGPTSQDARKRAITRVVRLDAADQASLVAQGDRMVVEGKQVARYVEAEVSPNPLHWHFDCVTYRDAEIGADGRWLVTNWTLPLDGGDMRLKLRAI